MGIPRPGSASIACMLTRALAVLVCAAVAGPLGGCKRSGGEAESEGGDAEAPEGGDAEAPAADCPDEPIRETRAPDVQARHESAEYWLAKYADQDPSRLLLTPSQIQALDAKVAELPGGWRDPLDPAVADPELISRELDERLAWLRERVAAGTYLELEPGALERAGRRVAEATPIEGPKGEPGSLHFVVEETPLWCVPMSEGLFTEPVDREFDRNRCASLHPGEYLRALRSTQEGSWIYVDAGHSVGWIHRAEGAPLSVAFTAEDLREQLEGERLVITRDHGEFRAGTSYRAAKAEDPPGAKGVCAELPTATGLRRETLPPELHWSPGPLPFTRAAVFRQAFAMLEQPYGWGGHEGRRDCSRYLYDLFAQFGVRLARNSAVQAKLGTRSLDVSTLDEAHKRQTIREAAREGVVLLYMRGHIMLYLGHEGEHDYGISALSEYLVPCPGGPDTVHRLDKVALTTLELGRGSERRAFIERISRIAVFGPAEGSDDSSEPD